MSGLGLLLIGAGIAVHVQEVRGLDATEAAALASEVGRAIEARTASVAAVDDPAWAGCSGAAACLADIRRRTGAHEVVLVRAFAVGGRLRVTLERTSTGGEPQPLDLARDAREWRPPLDVGVRAMFAAGTPVIVPPLIAVAPEPRWWPWAAVGAGAVMAGVGVALGASSASTFSDLEGGLRASTPAEEARSGARGEAIAANVLFGAAAVAVAVGVVGWLAE